MNDSNQNLSLEERYFNVFSVFPLTIILINRYRVQNSSTPLWKLPYEKQIEEKSSNIKQILRKTLFKMERVNKDLIYWWQKQRDSNEAMCCQLSEVIHSVILVYHMRITKQSKYGLTVGKLKASHR